MRRKGKFDVMISLLPCERCKVSIDKCNRRCWAEKYIRFTLERDGDVHNFFDCLLYFYVKRLKNVSLAKQVALSFSKMVEVDELEIENARRRLKYRGWI